MSLVINAPQVESELRIEAAKRGITAADYAADILASHLEPLGSNTVSAAAPFHASATTEQWNSAFDAWVDSHPPRNPLPDSALSRDSFYEGRA